MSPEIKATVPRFMLDSGLPAEHFEAMLKLEASINAEPGRLLGVITTLPKNPTEEERQAEPFIDLILLATDMHTGLDFDEVTQAAITSKIEESKKAMRPKLGELAALRGKEPISGEAMRRNRLTLYIGRVLETQQASADIIEAPRLIMDSELEKSVGKSDSAAA